MGLSDIAAQSIGIPEPSARFLIALFSGKSLTYAAKPRRIHPCFKSLHAALYQRATPPSSFVQLKSCTQVDSYSAIYKPPPESARARQSCFSFTKVMRL